MPTEPKGRITQYIISITWSGFNYYNPVYCTISGEDELVTILVDNPREHNFTKGLPYSKYSVQVQAHNSNKQSDFSEAENIVTKRGKKSFNF